MVSEHRESRDLRNGTRSMRTKIKIMESRKEQGRRVGLSRAGDRWKCKMAILQIHLRDNLRLLPLDEASSTVIKSELRPVENQSGGETNTKNRDE